jgi:hypothetical protein
MSRLPGLLLFVVPFTILHAGATFFVGLTAYAEYRSPSGAIYSSVFNVLLSPTRLLPQSVLNGIPQGLDYALILANSFLWSVCIAALWTLIRSRMVRRSAGRGFSVGPATQAKDSN